jgi:hypothetical protein
MAKRTQPPQAMPPPPTISPAEGKRRLEYMRDKGREMLSKHDVSDDATVTWANTTLGYIKDTFGSSTPHKSTFIGQQRMRVSGGFGTSWGYEQEHRNYERENAQELDRRCKVLDNLIKTIEIENDLLSTTSDKGLSDPNDVQDDDVVDLVVRICERFPLVAKQLRVRHGNRGTFQINDEYDVQDLIHAILRLHFDDIRPEEWVPSYAGSSSRMDFLLKKEKIVVEAKKTRNGLSAREVGEQLIVDIEKYQRHQDCKTLICFVYDPEGLIANPRGIENDLNGDRQDICVRVIIAPKI